MMIDPEAAAVDDAGDAAAVDPQLADLDARVAVHDLDDVAGLVGQALEGGAHQVGPVGAAGEAQNRAASSPVRSRSPAMPTAGTSRSGSPPSPSWITATQPLAMACLA